LDGIGRAILQQLEIGEKKPCGKVEKTRIKTHIFKPTHQERSTKDGWVNIIFGATRNERLYNWKLRREGKKEGQTLSDRKKGKRGKEKSGEGMKQRHRGFGLSNGTLRRRDGKDEKTLQIRA